MNSILYTLRGHCVLVLTGLMLALAAQAKMAPERWSRATEEERHQLTRAERYFDQKDFKSALAEYELFLQLYAKSEVASYGQLMAGECTRRLGQVNAAINEFRNVIDYFPDSVDAGAAQYSIGVCQTQSGDTEQALVSFEKVISKWPGEGFGALARQDACTIYWRLGQADKWLPHMEYLAAGVYADTHAIRTLSQRRLVTHLLFSKNIAGAYAIVAAAHKKEPLVAFAGWSADALGEAAIPAFYGAPGKQVLPDIGLACVALIEKESASVADPAQKAVLDRWCARILARAGLPEKATERFAALTKKEPVNDSLRGEYASHLRACGQRNEARLVYHEMKDPLTGEREIAETYAEESNWKSCIEAYQSMLSKYPQKSNDLQWRLGEVFQQSNKLPEAIAAYQQSQHEPQALFRIAECQGGLKQNDAAIQTLVGVINFFKSSAAEAQYRTAGFHAAKGDTDAAIRTLKTVCKVYLNTPWAGRAHQDLSGKYGVDVTLGGASKKANK